MVVVFVDHFRGNVVGRAQLLFKVSLGVVDKRSTEIDDFDLVELFVLLEKNVLGLEIAVDNVGTVAVVDARKYLLHKNSSVLLYKFASVQDFVEEFTTLADPLQNICQSFSLQRKTLLTRSRGSSAFHLRRTRTFL